MKILKCFKGSAEIWAEVHNVEWGSYEDFEVAFRNKYWSEEDQEILRSKIMGNGNFGRMNNHLTIYVMTIYNEAKYLEPPLPFRSDVYKRQSTFRLSKCGGNKGFWVFFGIF